MLAQETMTSVSVDPGGRIAHESTGGHATTLGAVAQACGYARVTGTDSFGELTRLVSGHSPSAGPTLVHFRVRTGALPNVAARGRSLPRSRNA